LGLPSAKRLRSTASKRCVQDRSRFRDRLLHLRVTNHINGPTPVPSTVFFLFRSEAVRVALTRKASSTSPFPERISCGRFFSRTPTGRKVRCLALTVLVQCRTPLHTCHVPFDAGSEYAMGTCIRFVGSGREENANNSYPHKVMLIRTVTKRDTNVFTNRVEARYKCFYKSCRSVMQLFLRTVPKCQTMQRLLCYG